ncbi:hypothetical protein ACROYT_G030176 [Oculina patagonica]
MLSEVVAQECDHEDMYSIKGMMLKRHIIKTMKTSISPQCFRACKDEVRCQSINYVMLHNICELNNATKESKPEYFAPSPDRYYITVKALVRLVNGGANYGRVEVYHNGQWGTVCDDDWDINDANVVCKQLGFPSASSAPQVAAYGQGSDPIWMDNVNCQGGEALLFDCAHTGWGIHNCGHHEDASVVCNI